MHTRLIVFIVLVVVVLVGMSAYSWIGRMMQRRKQNKTLKS